MKTSIGALAVLFLISCGAHEEAHDSAKAAVSEAKDAVVASAQAVDAKYVTNPGDNRIGLPPYPDSKELAHSRVGLRTDIGETLGVSYETDATPAEVEAFYKTEAAKLGTLEESMSLGEQLKSVGVKQTDGSTLAVKAMTDGKGRTVITMHKFVPTKK